MRSAMRTAWLWTSARMDSDSVMTRAIWASRVWSPTLSARMVRSPSSTTVPA